MYAIRSYYGLGDDGHTASIFPDQFELLEDERSCAVAQHPITGQKRITVTGNVITSYSIHYTKLYDIQQRQGDHLRALQVTLDGFAHLVLRDQGTAKLNFFGIGERLA